MMNTQVPERHVPPPPPFANPPYAYPPATPVTAPAPAVDPRFGQTAIALLVAATAILVAMVTRSWFTAPHGGFLGPLGVESCRGDVCQAVSWFDAKRVPTEVPMFATF